ncbi:hypothetical protein IKE98_03990 [Candidatus Saccharibacteria bacterium]|nr:hypothetical protein [Candidatus Saccharibacteria bacterium]
MNETITGPLTGTDRLETDTHPEDFETFRQIQLSEASVDVAKSLTNIAPQFSENGGVKYYICGSLAQNILPSVSKLQTFRQTKDGDIIASEEISMTDEARSSFLSGVRRKGDDFDIVTISHTPEESAKDNGYPVLNFEAIKEGCSDKSALSIIQAEPRFAIPTYDFLDDTQDEGKGFGDYFYAVATLKTGEKIAIASPAALVGGKAYELMGLRKRIANGKKVKEGKLEKDERDLTALCEGFVQFYGVNNLAKGAIEAMKNRVSNSSYDEDTRLLKEAQLKEVVTEFSTRRQK